METASKRRTNCGLPRQGKKQRYGTQATVDHSTAQPAADDFLRHKFLPLADSRSAIWERWQAVEREFFTSLSYLSDLYGLVPLKNNADIFPYNIKKALHNATKQLKILRPKLSLIVVQDDTHAACLATIRPLEVGANLYYIPLRPLRDMLRDRRKKKLAAMVLSAYSYLYQVVKLPNYADGDTYLSGVYGMIEEWLTADPDDYDPDSYHTCCSDTHAARWYGRQLTDMMKHPYHLGQFSDRVSSFHPQDEAEAQMHEVCRRILALYQQYPDSPVYGNFHGGWIATDEDDLIYLEQYISFYWDYADSIYQHLFESVNNDLQEKSIMDEPLGVQLFDRPQVTASNHELDFERRLFELINDLAALL